MKGDSQGVGLPPSAVRGFVPDEVIEEVVEDGGVPAGDDLRALATAAAHRHGLTRILWLSGCQPGYNRLGSVDTMQRFVYIHGTPDEEPMRVPYSHGCIRMRNADMLELFDRIDVGTSVDLVP